MKLTAGFFEPCIQKLQEYNFYVICPSTFESVFKGRPDSMMPSNLEDASQSDLQDLTAETNLKETDIKRTFSPSTDHYDILNLTTNSGNDLKFKVLVKPFEYFL